MPTHALSLLVSVRSVQVWWDLFHGQCASEGHGKIMMLGEFTSVTYIHSLISRIVPTPQGGGTYRVGYPCTYFFLSDFLDMHTSAPDPIQFVARIAEKIAKVSQQTVCLASKSLLVMLNYRIPLSGEKAGRFSSASFFEASSSLTERWMECGQN